MAQTWEVVGGASTGGLIVRTGKGTDTDQCPDRLLLGSVVEEVQLLGGRLNYKLNTGYGPQTGWVSTTLKGKDLLVKVNNSAFNWDDLPDLPDASGIGAPIKKSDKPPIGNSPEAEAMIAARCEKELARPALIWTPITVNTVLDNHMNIRPGMSYGIDFPWNEETLMQFGPEWLTKAFHLVGSMKPDNKVTKIILEKKIKVTTGNNGGKFLFEVEYEKPDPDLHTKLFAKVPHPLEGVTKQDRLSSSVNKQPSELYEINAYRLLEAILPMKTPKFYYGDISNETSNWIIINERIDFHDFLGQNFGRPKARLPALPAWEIEGPYDKCIDHNLRGDPKEYYMLMTYVGAKMAALSKTGKMGSEALIQGSFGPSGDPADLKAWGMNPAACSGELPKQVMMKTKSAMNFMSGFGSVCFPDFCQDEKFQQKFLETMMTVNAYGAELRY
jgi:hypothetical protein